MILIKHITINKYSIKTYEAFCYKENIQKTFKDKTTFETIQLLFEYKYNKLKLKLKIIQNISNVIRSLNKTMNILPTFLLSMKNIFYKYFIL